METQPNRWVITLPMYHPPSMNLYARNKGVRVSAVPKLMKLLEPWSHALARSEDKIPPATRKRLVLIHLIYGPGVRRLDSDNAVKVVKDALKNVGLLVNDSPDWCECPEPTDERGLFNATRITLSDIASDASAVAGSGDWGNEGFSIEVLGHRRTGEVAFVLVGPMRREVFRMAAADAPRFSSLLREAASGVRR